MIEKLVAQRGRDIFSHDVIITVQDVIIFLEEKEYFCHSKFQTNK